MDKLEKMHFHQVPYLTPASLEDYPTIQNMARFYVYDMSRFCGYLPGWESPANGLFECTNLECYFDEPNRFPFLVRIKEELAGFVLINKIGTHEGVDWNMGEFFILAKFQGAGIGYQVAHEAFKKFPGNWEVAVIPQNTRALYFWRKTIGNFANNLFSEKEETIMEPKPHPMVILSFKSPETL